MEGFGLLDGVTVDTHFSARQRLPRLAQFLISGRCQKGIGLDENTGLTVYADGTCEVIGAGMVAILDSAGVTGSNYHTVAATTHLRFNDMRIGFLAPATRFSLHRWTIL
jgi:cyanophycinase